MGRVEDRWLRKDRTRSPDYGRGLRWRAVWEDDTGRERKKSFAVKDAAVKHVADKTVNGDRPASELTIGELWPRYRSTKNNTGPGSQQAYDAAWAHHLKKRWEKVKAEDVTTADLREWIPSLRTIHCKPLSAAYEGYLMGVMKAVLEHAVEAKAITVNPMARVKRRKKKTVPRRYLTVTQADKLLKAVKPHDLIVLFMLRTGVRRGEAAVVTVADLDVRRRRVRIESGIDTDGSDGDTKTGEHRDVPVRGELLEKLKAVAKGKGRTDYLMPDPDGNAWTRHKWRPVWDKVRGATGIPDFDTHELRHTAVSWAIHSGANVKTIQAMVGHASAAMTLDVYGHLWSDELDEVVGRVDEFIQAQRVKSAEKEPPPKLPEGESSA
jgi:integrase